MQSRPFVDENCDSDRVSSLIKDLHQTFCVLVTCKFQLTMCVRQCASDALMKSMSVLFSQKNLRLRRYLWSCSDDHLSNKPVVTPLTFVMWCTPDWAPKYGWISQNVYDMQDTTRRVHLSAHHWLTTLLVFWYQVCFTRSLATHLHRSTLIAVCQELFKAFSNLYIGSNLGKLRRQRLFDGVPPRGQAKSNNCSGKVNRLDHPNGYGFASSLDLDSSWPIPRTYLNLSVNMKSGGSPGRVTFTLTLIITCHLWAPCVQLVRSAVWHVIHDTSTRWRHLGVWEYVKNAASSAALTSERLDWHKTPPWRNAISKNTGNQEHKENHFWSRAIPMVKD